jgi:hypothetical protein
VYADDVTLAVVFKGSDGLALAVDSRITLRSQPPSGGEVHYSHFDNATKLFSFQGQQHVGAVVYGTAAIGSPPRTIHGFIPEFEERLDGKYKQPDGKIKKGTVAEIAAELGDFYAEQWKQVGMPAPGGPVEPMVFLVAGFDEGEPYGRVYEVVVPNATSPTEKNPGTAFGVSWGGMGDLANRIINGTDPRAAKIAQDHLGLSDQQAEELAEKWRNELTLPVPYQFLPLQDCVDLTAFLVNMTSVVQTWTVGVQGVGGNVDVAIVTRTEGFKAVRQKWIEVRE